MLTTAAGLEQMHDELAYSLMPGVTRYGSSRGGETIPVVQLWKPDWTPPAVKSDPVGTAHTLARAAVATLALAAAQTGQRAALAVSSLPPSLPLLDLDAHLLPELREARGPLSRPLDRLPR